MTASQAKAILQASRMVGLKPTMRQEDQDIYQVSFGSEFKFIKYEAARALILAFEIEKAK
jgi:hypothetical protein